MVQIHRALLVAVALAAALPAAGADDLLYVPFLNGNFEGGAAGWALGPGASVRDVDFTGDAELVLALGASGSARASWSVPQGPTPPTLPLTFTVERGPLHNVAFRLDLVDLRDASTQTLSWARASVPEGRQFIDLTTADLEGEPDWKGMDSAARQAELGHYVIASLHVHADNPSQPFGASIDNIQIVVRG